MYHLVDFNEIQWEPFVSRIDGHIASISWSDVFFFWSYCSFIQINEKCFP